MSVTRVLLDILIVLVAAKLAAEGAERVGVPAVVGEIIAGVLVGPSALGWIRGDEVLRVLGELGVILLLLDVGLEMDLGELAAVGRAAISVATVGVVAPMAAGAGVALALGLNGKEALFVGAALTATSVGITARVFGDLRALATVEARTVLGAAVADDVMGLVILTVVTRLVAEGSVSIAGVALIVLIAVAFLVGSAAIGVRVAPPVFDHISRLSRSGGTLVALSLAFTLGLAELASAAKLAPIVGAFVAGLALSRCEVAPRIRRELTPVGHLLIPVFFLQIGIDAQLSQFARGRVLGIAALLLVVAVAGKLVAAVGLLGAPGDRLLVGLGMIPRGEVGLIFATLGLSQHIIGRDVYAALLLVVLVSTLATPPLLKWRLRTLATRGPVAASAPTPSSTPPPGGWLEHHDGTLSHTVDLAAEPPPGAALTIALMAALDVASGRQPGPRLTTWLTTLPTSGSLPWDKTSVARLFNLLEHSDGRAWRFLLVTGVLDRCLPDLAVALRHRLADPTESDPTLAMSWPRLDQLNRAALGELPHPERIRLAALVLDATEQTPDIDQPVVLARRIVARLQLGATVEQAVAGLVSDADLLPAAASRLDGLDEEPVLQLASHLVTPEQAHAVRFLAATASLDELARARLAALCTRLDSAMAHPELVSREARNLVERRRAEAEAIVPLSADRLLATPRSFVLSQAAGDLARQAALVDDLGARDEIRIAVTPVEPERWRIDVALVDRVGLLAHQLEVLGDSDHRVLDVATVVWPDEHTLSSFRVSATTTPDADVLHRALVHAMATPLVPVALPEASVTFDNDSSPWHTICTVRTVEGGPVLHAVATAVALADVNVVAARKSEVADDTYEVLELVDRRGALLSPELQARVLSVLHTGQPPPSPKRWPSVMRRRP